MTLWRITMVVAAVNLMTYGNGPIMVPLLHTYLVDDTHVLTQEQMLYAFTIGRITPGQANVFVASIGYMLHGLTGAILTTLVMLVPGYLALPVMRGYERVRHWDWVPPFTKGLTVTSVGLIFAAVVQISRGALTEPIAWVVLATTLFLAQVVRWNAFAALAAASALGLVAKLLF
jgi:chromate transporter